MPDVIAELLEAVNAHDLDRAARLFHRDYHSEQPAHPARTFTGRAQFRANWAAMFAGVPDFRADLGRVVTDGGTSWVEWSWSGTRTDGRPFAMSGVVVFEIDDGLIVAGRLYMEEVDPSGSIEQTVQHLSGRAPQAADAPHDAP